jgi:hypothetical protein
MKNEFIKNASLSLEGGIYETPSVMVAEILSEGVLCQSGNFEQWGEETLPW